MPKFQFQIHAENVKWYELRPAVVLLQDYRCGADAMAMFKSHLDMSGQGMKGF